MRAPGVSACALAQTSGASAHRAEQLVSVHHLLHRDGALLHLIAALLGELDDALARDARQNGATAGASAVRLAHQRRTRCARRCTRLSAGVEMRLPLTTKMLQDDTSSMYLFSLASR